jgi:hypothetical protein
MLAQFRRGLDLGQCAGDALPGVVDGDVDRFALLALEAVFLVPDVVGSGLQRYFRTPRVVPGSATSARTLFIASAISVSRFLDLLLFIGRHRRAFAGAPARTRATSAAVPRHALSRKSASPCRSTAVW